MNKRRVIIIIICAVLLVLISIFIYKKAEEFDKTAEAVVIPEIPDRLTLRMVGDNLIHNSVYFAAQNENGYNFDMLFENVKEDIESADLAIINQETIFVKDSRRYSSYPTFGSPTEVGDAIYKAGFDVVTHATNHTMDKGTSGILDTISFWEENYPDIKVLGIHKDDTESDITYIEKNNIKLSFINYTYGLNGINLPKDKQYMVDLLGDDERMKLYLNTAKETSDVVTAILHIGTEYVYEPTKYHKDYVEFCIDNGADIVLCAHPHVLEPYGEITTKNGNKGLVYYSLGNFMSNQKKVPTLLGGMANITLERNESGEVLVKDYSLTPIVTHYSGKYYSTYKLEDYTDELAKTHTISKTTEFSTKILTDLYDKIMKN